MVVHRHEPTVDVRPDHPADGGDVGVTGADTPTVQAITSADVIKAANILRKYKDGKSALEMRLAGLNCVGYAQEGRSPLLRRSVLGELFVETYYTFGPPVAGVVPDIANSALFNSACTSDPPPATVHLTQGPAQAYVLAVPTASSQTAITLEEAYLVFGFGMAGMIAPWTDEAQLFIRTVTKSTLLAWAANLGVPADRWKGVRLDGSARSKVASNSIVTNGYDVSVAGTVAGTFTDTSYTLDAPSTAKATGAITGNDEQVTGNRIGIFSNGTKAPGSGSAGISAWSGTSRVLLQDNTVAGHSSNEISLYRGSGHQVLKNRIGVDPTGATVLGGTLGIVAQGTVDASIGTSTTTGNQLGGLTGTAILVNTFSDSPGTGAKVVGNRIGLLADGTTGAPIGGAGVAATAPTTKASSVIAMVRLRPVW